MELLPQAEVLETKAHSPQQVTDGRLAVLSASGHPPLGISAGLPKASTAPGKASLLRAPLAGFASREPQPRLPLARVWVWGARCAVCCHFAQAHPFVARDEASCTDDSYSDMLQFLPDLSQVISLETTTGRETTVCLNAVEVVYLTIRRGKKVCFTYTGF